MIPLDVPIIGDFILVFGLGLVLLIGIPFLTTVLMKLYWKVAGRKYHIKTGKAHYKGIIPFVSIFIFSTIAVLLLVYLLISLLQHVIPATT